MHSFWSLSEKLPEVWYLVLSKMLFFNLTTSRFHYNKKKQEGRKIIDNILYQKKSKCTAQQNVSTKMQRISYKTYIPFKVCLGNSQNFDTLLCQNCFSSTGLDFIVKNKKDENIDNVLNQMKCKCTAQHNVSTKM